jgi:ArsR family transcriptional regulator, arsenate/arsenite/antimonite-responsive transcriptional repressor
MVHRRAIEPVATVCCSPLVDEPLEAVAAADLAMGFRALGDPVRLRLLSLIASAADGEVCVCDLNAPFHVTGPTISHHLKVLREAGLIQGERRGTWIYYRIVPTALTDLSRLLDATAATVPGAAVPG